MTEATPREVGAVPEPHVFEAAARSAEWAASGTSSSRLSGILDDALSRRREAYAAFLWKRLQPPRAFV